MFGNVAPDPHPVDQLGSYEEGYAGGVPPTWCVPVEQAPLVQDQSGEPEKREKRGRDQHGVVRSHSHRVKRIAPERRRNAEPGGLSVPTAASRP